MSSLNYFGKKFYKLYDNICIGERWNYHSSIETTEKYNTRQHIDILQSFCQMVIDFFHVLPTALA